MSKIQVIHYSPQFLPAYVQLNRQWIETYFRIERMDLVQLEKAQESILDLGGEIFFVLLNDQAVGTCAMIPHGPDCYELAKMAVDPSQRGQGLGDLLMETALNWARSKKAKKVLLLSNTILEPALSLYQKFGFRTVHLGPHPDYERCNIEMQIDL